MKNYLKKFICTGMITALTLSNFQFAFANNKIDESKVVNYISSQLTYVLGENTVGNYQSDSSFLTKPTIAKDDVEAKIDYLDSAIDSKYFTARVTIGGGDINTSRNYYAEVYCSWDQEAWYKETDTTITIPVGCTSTYTDLNYKIYKSGVLYTKVVLYDSEVGSQILETEPTQINVNIWYYMAIEDPETGVVTEYYISADNATNDSEYMITKRSDESLWIEYTLKDEDWVETGKTYSSDPIEN
jgi:hypothetical protein